MNHVPYISEYYHPPRDQSSIIHDKSHHHDVQSYSLGSPSRLPTTSMHNEFHPNRLSLNQYTTLNQQSPSRSMIQSQNQSPSRSIIQSQNQSPSRSMIQSQNQSPSRSMLQSTSQSLIQSTSQSPSQSPSQSANQSPNQSSSQSANHLSSQSPSQLQHQSMIQTQNQSPSKSMNTSMNSDTSPVTTVQKPRKTTTTGIGTRKRGIKKKRSKMKMEIEEKVPPSIPSGSLDELARQGITCFRLLGAGTYGQVWEARLAEGTLVAVKILFDPYSDDTGSKCKHGLDQGLLAEIAAQMYLDHPNVVRILRVVELPVSNTLALMMPLGTKTLSDVLDEFRTNLDAGPDCREENRERREEKRHLYKTRRMQLTGQFLGGVSHINANGLVHLDLKPSNTIMLSNNSIPSVSSNNPTSMTPSSQRNDDDRPAITDFGLCRSILGRAHGRAPDEVVTRWWRPADLQLGLECGLSSAADTWSAGLIGIEILFDIMIFNDITTDIDMIDAVAERIGWPEEFISLLKSFDGIPSLSMIRGREHKAVPQKNGSQLAHSLLKDKYDAWRTYYGPELFDSIWNALASMLQVMPARRTMTEARSIFVNWGLVDNVLPDEGKKGLLETELIHFAAPRFNVLALHTRQHAERLMMRVMNQLMGRARPNDLEDALANVSSKLMYDYIYATKWSSVQCLRVAPVQIIALQILGYALWM